MRYTWRFRDDNIVVSWKPRDRVFEIKFDPGLGQRRLQTVHIPDGDDWLALKLMDLMNHSYNPRFDLDGVWPDKVCYENAIPTDDHWHRRKFASVLVDISDPDAPVSVMYTDDADEAVEHAMVRWAEMDDGIRAVSKSMAVKITNDFPVSHRYTVCMWMSESYPSETCWTGFLPVVRSGNSMIVRLTEVCKRLGIEPGEEVEISVRRRKGPM